MPLPTRRHSGADTREYFQELASDPEQWTMNPFRRLIGTLWNCTDIVPADTCERLDCPTGSTYAQCCRSMLRWLKKA